MGTGNTWPDFQRSKSLLEVHTATHFFLVRCRWTTTHFVRVYSCQRSGLPSWLQRKALRAPTGQWEGNCGAGNVSLWYDLQVYLTSHVCRQEGSRQQEDRMWGLPNS